MKMKILVILMAAVICISLFAGCQDSDSTIDATDTPDTSDAQSTSGDAEEQATEPPDEIILKGPGQEETLEFSVILNAIMWTKNNLDINESEELKAWEEYSNTDITFITPPGSEYEEKLSIMTAGGDLPDVIVSGSSDKFDVNDLIDADAIIPLDDLFDQYGSKFLEMYEDKGFDYCKVMGVIYGIPVYTTYYAQVGFMARQDWLDNLGLGKPTTLDEYADMMRAFKNDDPDQNGVDDTYAMTFRDSLDYSQGFIRSFGIDDQKKISYDYVDGELVPQQTQQKYKDYLEFMNMLWEEGLFTPNSMTNTSDQWKTEIFTGVAGMWFHQTYRIEEYFMTQFKNVQGEDTTVELTALEPPTGYNGEKSSILNRPVIWGIYLNRDSEETESIFNYYMWVFTDDESREYAKYGIEGTHHTVDGAGNKTIIEEALGNDVYNKWKELVFITSNYPIDAEEASLRYGEIGYENHELNVKYGAHGAVEFNVLGKPTLQAEDDYPDIDSIVLEYTVKIISGELDLDEGFDAMVEELNNNGLEEVTAERQEWYIANTAE